MRGSDRCFGFQREIDHSLVFSTQAQDFRKHQRQPGFGSQFVKTRSAHKQAALYITNSDQVQNSETVCTVVSTSIVRIARSTLPAAPARSRKFVDRDRVWYANQCDACLLAELILDRVTSLLCLEVLHRAMKRIGKLCVLFAVCFPREAQILAVAIQPMSNRISISESYWDHIKLLALDSQNKTLIAVAKGGEEGWQRGIANARANPRPSRLGIWRVVGGSWAVALVSRTLLSSRRRRIPHDPLTGN